MPTVRAMPVYIAGGRRYARRRVPVKYRKAYRLNRKVQRLYPSREYGYMAIPRTAETAARFGQSWRSATEEQRAARKASRYYGRGSYWSKLWRGVIKPIGRAALGGALAGGRGAALSMLQGQGLYTGDGLYTGQGSYDPTTSNDLVSGGGDSVASFASAADETGALLITNKEYICDIYGNEKIGTENTRPFMSRTFELNPGLESTFPWLSQLAQNYEEYELKQLMFTYKSVVQDINSENGQCGTIIMATIYNPDLPTFKDKASMLQYAHSASSKSTDDMIHGVECDPTKLSGAPGHYIRNSPITQSLGDYDHGKFVMGVANTPAVLANGTIGELWVSYTVVLRKPKIVSGKGLTISRALAVLRNPADNLGTSASNRLDYFGCTLPVGRTTTQLVVAKKSSLDVRFWSPVGWATCPYLKHGAPGIVDDGSTIFDAKYKDGSVVAKDSNDNAVPVGLAIVLPASYSGTLSITMSVEMDIGTSTVTSTSKFGLFLPLMQGNVRPKEDMYSGGSSLYTSESSSNPSWYVRSIGDFRLDANEGTQARAILTFHVDCQAASNNADNVIYWVNNHPGTGNEPYLGCLFDHPFAYANTIQHRVIQSSIDITEYNSSLMEDDSIKFLTPDKQLVTVP